MKRAILLAGCLLALSAPAAFAAKGAYYLGLHGGLAIPEGVENDSDAGSFNLEFDPGWLAGASLGYDLRSAHPDIGVGRVELEFAWRENALDQVEFRDPSIGAGGKARAASLMFNTIGEYRPTLPWLPYIGAGAGAARITLEDLTEGGAPLVDDRDTVFAWQVLTGVGFRAGKRVCLDLGYRYFSAVNPRFTDALGVDFDSGYAVHTLTLGARFDF